MYSICITHLNDDSTIRESLESILDQIDGSFEIVVVDQGSTDGSLEYLEQLAATEKIRLFHQQVRNRGLGRQKAFEKSNGEYIIAGIDMDDVYLPSLRELLRSYHRACDGQMIRVVSGSVTIAPRKLIEELGGWHNLHRYEDLELWQRANKIGKFRWVEFPIYAKINCREKIKFRELHRLIGSYANEFMAGTPDAFLLSKRNILRFFPFAALGWLVSLLKPRYHLPSPVEMCTDELRTVLTV
jgi:glycosyltransferase involved in cell wall biosynthesis